MDITALDVPEEDANRVRQMQMSTMEWDESGEAELRKGFRKGKRSKFRGERPSRLSLFCCFRFCCRFFVGVGVGVGVGVVCVGVGVVVVGVGVGVGVGGVGVGVVGVGVGVVDVAVVSDVVAVVVCCCGLLLLLVFLLLPYYYYVCTSAVATISSPGMADLMIW